MRPLTLMLLLLTGCDLFRPPLSDEERARVSAQLAEALKDAEARDAAWRKAMAAAPTTIAPQPDLGACDRVSMPSAHGIGDAALNEQLRMMVATHSVLQVNDRKVLKASALAEAHSPRFDGFQRRAHDIENDADPQNGMLRSREDAEKLLADAAELVAPDWWTWDVTVVIDDEARPEVAGLDPKTFEAGATVGRSYVFDYPTKSIVCAGTFVATSSSKVKYTTGLVDMGEAHGAVALDLEARTLAAGIDALKKAGPLHAAHQP